MAEIFGDMALGASDKDDGDDVAEEDEMVEMPDFFARVRPLLMSARGTPRLIVQLAPWLVLSGLVLMPVALWMIPGVGTADSCCFQTAFEARRAALMVSPSLEAYRTCRLCAAPSNQRRARSQSSAWAPRKSRHHTSRGCKSGEMF